MFRAIDCLALLGVLLAPVVLCARDIVSTFPAGTEILRALDLDDRIAAVSDFCVQDGSLPTVGSAIGADFETIARIGPKWMLVPEMAGNRRLLDFARKFRIGILVLGIERIDDIRDSVLKVGGSFGRRSKARRVVGQLYPRFEKGTGDRVLVVVGARRRGRFFTDIVAASRATFYADMISGMGWKPVALGPGRYPVVSPEVFARLPIDRLVFVTVRSRPGDLRRWRALNPVIGKIHVLEGSRYFVPGPGIAARFMGLGEEP